MKGRAGRKLSWTLEGSRGAGHERWATSDTRCGRLCIIHMSRVGELRYLQMGQLDAARREKQQDPRRRSVRRHSHICSGGKERQRGLISLEAGIRRLGGQGPLSRLPTSPTLGARFFYYLVEGISRHPVSYGIFRGLSLGV